MPSFTPICYENSNLSIFLSSFVASLTAAIFFVTKIGTGTELGGGEATHDPAYIPPINSFGRTATASEVVFSVLGSCVVWGRGSPRFKIVNRTMIGCLVSGRIWLFFWRLGLVRELREDLGLGLGILGEEEEEGEVIGFRGREVGRQS